MSAEESKEYGLIDEVLVQAKEEELEIADDE
jgi:ATP-dependent protease ClpP protease subunit